MKKQHSYITSLLLVVIPILIVPMMYDHNTSDTSVKTNGEELNEINTDLYTDAVSENYSLIMNTLLGESYLHSLLRNFADNEHCLDVANNYNESNRIEMMASFTNDTELPIPLLRQPTCNAGGQGATSCSSGSHSVTCDDGYWACCNSWSPYAACLPKCEWEGNCNPLPCEPTC